MAGEERVTSFIFSKNPCVECNLYPFAFTLANKQVSFEELWLTTLDWAELCGVV